MESKNNLKQLLQMKNSTTISVDFYIYGDIVSAEWGAWDSEDTYPLEIRNFLDEANGRDVNIYINSGGGSVFAGLAIANMLKRYDGKTRSYIDGLCGSIATIIALSCDEKYIADNALFMYHQACGGLYIWGNANHLSTEVDGYVKSLNAVNISLVDTYKQNLTDESHLQTIQDNMDSGNDTWLTADETVGFFNIQKTESKELVAYAESNVYNKETAPKKLFQKLEKPNLTNVYMFDF